MFSPLTDEKGFLYFDEASVEENVATLAELGVTVSPDVWDTSLLDEIALLDAEIDSGIEEHHRLRMRKLDSPIVSGISDLIGGAELPDRSIWDYPRKLALKARELNANGDVFKSPPYLVVAGIATRNNANLLAKYADKSEAGAAFAVKILKVAKTAGQIAESAAKGVTSSTEVDTGSCAG